MQNVNIKKYSLTHETLGKKILTNCVKLIKESEMQTTMITHFGFYNLYYMFILWLRLKEHINGGTKCFRTERESIPRLFYCYLFAVNCESFGVETNKNLMRRVQRNIFCIKS